MTIRQLEAFLAVVKAGSFRGAAARLHLSQPAVSQHVRELEAELGMRLLDRAPRALAVTEAGRAVEDHANRLMAILSSVHETVAALRGLRRGRLVVGASTTPGLYVLPRAMAGFRARHPGIELVLRTGNSRFIEERLRAGEVDLGVIGGHVLETGETCLAAGLDDELVVVVPPEHAWARQREVPPAWFAREPLLLREEGSATRRLTERALEGAGVAFQRGMELDHTEAIKRAVAAGLGVAFISQHAVREEVDTGHLRALRLRGVRLRRHFHVVHGPARILTPAARAFAAYLATSSSGRATSPVAGRPAAPSLRHDPRAR